MALGMINRYLEFRGMDKIDEGDFLLWLEKNPQEEGSILSRMPNKKDWLQIKTEIIRVRDEKD